MNFRRALLALAALAPVAALGQTSITSCNGSACVTSMAVVNPDGSTIGSAVPTAASSNALGSSTTAGASTNVLKSSAGNVYSLNAVNSTVAGFVVLYDAASAPTSGTALTTSLIRYCYSVPASGSFDKVFQMPMAMTNGATLLFSTSCTTYTAPGTPPILLTGQVK